MTTNRLIDIHQTRLTPSDMFSPSAQPWTPEPEPKWPSRSCTGRSSRSCSPSGRTESWGSSNTWNMKMWATFQTLRTVFPSSLLKMRDKRWPPPVWFPSAGDRPVGRVHCRPLPGQTPRFVSLTWHQPCAQTQHDIKVVRVFLYVMFSFLIPKLPGDAVHGDGPGEGAEAAAAVRRKDPVFGLSDAPRSEGGGLCSGHTLSAAC